jgi:predicted negative regulator of RcsB-dependent stress response
MTNPDLGSAAIGLGIIAAGLFQGWQNWRTRKVAHQAAAEATRAADNAHPVSNGWGSKITADLTYLRQGMDSANARLDAMDRRANSADDRANAHAAALNAHLAEHARERATA